MQNWSYLDNKAQLGYGHPVPRTSSENYAIKTVCYATSAWLFFFNTYQFPEKKKKGGALISVHTTMHLAVDFEHTFLKTGAGHRTSSQWVGCMI